VRYRTIVADPPWLYPGDGPPRGRKVNGDLDAGVNTKTRYGAMSLWQLKALTVPAAADAHLYLWTTNTFLVEAHDLARAWGFAPKTVLTWTKTHQGDPSRVSMKTGYYFRGATEHVLFCVRGALPLQTERGLPTGFLWPRLPHSVKPDAFYDLVTEASPGPYLEMFARRQRLGWDTWGNEALEHVELSATGGETEA
jgi:N6-adenosine-specific RNA methylase IME4